MKLFGKNLFTFKKPVETLYDFAHHNQIMNRGSFMFADMTLQRSKPKKRKELTPKELFELKSLNNNGFKIAADVEYLDKQLEEINAKLDFIGPKPQQKKSRNTGNVLAPDSYEVGGVKYGREELESIKLRLNNRRKIHQFTAIVEKYPHTSTKLVTEVLADNTNLAMQKADTFIPDFPSDAIKAMKEYEKFCLKLCNMKPVFYVIANQNDFTTVAERRDPILLAQSPFGHFWQILGAWDEEMIYLGDL